MPNHRLFLRCAAASAAALLSVGVAAAQPQLNVSCEQLGSGPLPSTVEGLVKDYVQHWAGVLGESDDDAQVFEARRRIEAGFEKCPDSAQYQFAYARTMVDAVQPLLGSEDRLRQVNAALAIARTRHMRVRPALDEMVRHPNPAVRYLGWYGYQRIRTLVLAQGRDYSKPMFASLAERARSETVPYVVRRILRTLYLPPVRPPVITEGDYRWAQQRAMEVFLGSWRAQCRRILLGKPEMPEAIQRGMLALTGFDKAFGEDPNQRVKLLQALVDAMYCASRAYDAADVDVGSEQQQAMAQRVRQANASLLQEAERHVNEISQLRRGHVTSALTDENVLDRGARVRQAVLKWVDDLKAAGLDIEEPSFEPPSNSP
jgi:hypothetical protein